MFGAGFPDQSAKRWRLTLDRLGRDWSRPWPNPSSPRLSCQVWLTQVSSRATCSRLANQGRDPTATQRLEISPARSASPNAKSPTGGVVEGRCLWEIAFFTQSGEESEFLVCRIFNGLRAIPVSSSRDDAFFLFGFSPVSSTLIRRRKRGPSRSLSGQRKTCTLGCAPGSWGKDRPCTACHARG